MKQLSFAKSLLAILLIAPLLVPLAYAASRDGNYGQVDNGNDTGNAPVDSSNGPPPLSSVDWTDDVSGSGSTIAGTGAPAIVETEHFTSIKSAIDLACMQCGINPNVVWSQSDPEAIAQIGATGREITYSQINGLRRAIQQLYIAKSLTVPTTMNLNSQEGERIHQSDIKQMRDALDVLLAGCGVPPTCGNGIPNAGEQCDLGAGNGVCPATCNTSCSTNVCVSCTDGIRNQGETGVDCGGPCAACQALVAVCDPSFMFENQASCDGPRTLLGTANPWNIDFFQWPWVYTSNACAAKCNAVNAACCQFHTETNQCSATQTPSYSYSDCDNCVISIGCVQDPATP